MTSLKVTSIAAPLRQQVAENIRGAMLSGRFKPGERLIERELCDMMGVSRTAVREALRQLESEGLVENIANRGPIVARITRTDAISIYEMRGVIEGLVGRLFTLRATDQQVRQLRAIVDRLKKAYEGADVARLLKVKTEFYAKLLEGAGNTTADAMLRMIHTRANFLRSVSLSQGDRRAESSKEMQHVMELIEARASEQVERAMQEHVANAAVAALQAIE
jgi:DNA-binding GntR family transcriptional regulator